MSWNNFRWANIIIQDGWQDYANSHSTLSTENGQTNGPMEWWQYPPALMSTEGKIDPLHCWKLVHLPLIFGRFLCRFICLCGQISGVGDHLLVNLCLLVGLQGLLDIWNLWKQCRVVNIGSGNGLVPSGNKPLPEPMLTYFHVASPGHNVLIMYVI